MRLATGLLLGFLLGMRHALEPDHLAAVAVLVARRRSSAAGVVLGAVWGAGHTAALLGVGCVLATVGARLPPRLAGGFELLVAVMLVTLGARALILGSVAPPSDGQIHGHEHAWRGLRQPLVVGMIHGLAGSGALTAVALAGLPSSGARLAYVLLFGLGSVIGMACLTGVAGWPLARVGGSQPARRWLSAATGAFSVLLGAVWGWTAIQAVIRG